MTDIDLLLRDFRADQPGPVAAPAAVAAAAKAARGPRRRQLRRRLLAGAGVTATVAGIAALLLVALPGGGGDRTAEIPGGYAAVATVRVTAPGGVTEAVMARVQGLIARRAAAQGVAGVEVRRSATDALTLVVPRSAGWERVLLLTEEPAVRVVDFTRASDVTTAPVVVAPDRITDITYAAGRLRIAVTDRVEGGLAGALVGHRRLALIGTQGDTWTVLGTIDTAASEALSSEAIVTTLQGTETGTVRRVAKTYAGGGTDASLTVETVRTEGTLPPGVVEVPLDILRALGPMVRPGGITRVIDSTLGGRPITEWEADGVDGMRRAVIQVAGAELFTAICPSTTLFIRLRVCGTGGGPGYDLVHGETMDGRADRVELWRDGTRYLALKADWRFVGLVPSGGGEVTVVVLDASGKVLASERAGLAAPAGRPGAGP